MKFRLPRILQHTLRRKGSKSLSAPLTPKTGASTPLVCTVASRKAASRASASASLASRALAPTSAVAMTPAQASISGSAASHVPSERPSTQSDFTAPDTRSTRSRNVCGSDAEGSDLTEAAVPVKPHVLLDKSKKLKLNTSFPTPAESALPVTTRTGVPASAHSVDCTDTPPSTHPPPGTPASESGKSAVSTAPTTPEDDDNNLVQEMAEQIRTALEDLVQQQSTCTPAHLEHQLQLQTESEPQFNSAENQSTLTADDTEPVTPKRLRQKVSITFFGPPPSPRQQWGELGLAALSWLAFGKGQQSESDLVTESGDVFGPVSTVPPPDAQSTFRLPNVLEGDSCTSCPPTPTPCTGEVEDLTLHSGASRIAHDDVPSFFKDPRGLLRNRSHFHFTALNEGQISPAAGMATPPSPFPRGHRRSKSTPIEVNFGGELARPRHRSTARALGENLVFNYRRRRSMPGKLGTESDSNPPDPVNQPSLDSPALPSVAEYPPPPNTPMTATVSVTAARIRIAFGIYITIKRRSPLTFYEEALNGMRNTWNRVYNALVYMPATFLTAVTGPRVLMPAVDRSQRLQAAWSE